MAEGTESKTELDPESKTDLAGKDTGFNPESKIDLTGKTMADFSYFTRRTLEGKDGKENGRAMVAVPKGSNIAQVAYTCPFCRHSEYQELEFVRAKSGVFKFKCGSCGKAIRVEKLSKKAKK